MAAPRITQKEIDHFNEDGFIIFDKFIDIELINKAVSRIETIFNGEFETGVVPDKIKWLKQNDEKKISSSTDNDNKNNSKEDIPTIN